MAGYDYDFSDRDRVMAERQKRRQELKRRHIRRQRIFYGCILLVLILIIVLIVHACSKDDTAETTEAETSQVTAEEDAAPEDASPEEDGEQELELLQVQLLPNTTTVRISSVGDIMTYDDQINAAAQADGSYDFSGCFSRVTDYLSAADVTTANLETTFTDGYDYTGSVPFFNAPVELATNLADAGFDMLTTANTYSILYGVSGLYSTIQHVRSAGLDNVGTYYTQEERNTNGGAILKDIGGVKVAFLAYTKNVNDMFVPEGSEYTVNILYEDYCDTYTGIKEDMLLSDVQAAKDAGAEIIIVLPHWGSEYVFTTRSTQEEIADLLFASGVDAIIGTHSHVVNAMETRQVTTVDGEEKTVFIAYGLGNFLSAMYRDYTRETVILNLEFEKDLDTGEVTLSNVNYIPCYIMDTGPDGVTKYQVVSIHDEMANYEACTPGCIDDETYELFTQALEDIHTHAGAEYDIAAIQEEPEETQKADTAAEVPEDEDASSQEGDEATEAAPAA